MSAESLGDLVGAFRKARGPWLIRAGIAAQLYREILQIPPGDDGFIEVPHELEEKRRENSRHQAEAKEVFLRAARELFAAIPDPIDCTALTDFVYALRTKSPTIALERWERADSFLERFADSTASTLSEDDYVAAKEVLERFGDRFKNPSSVTKFVKDRDDIRTFRPPTKAGTPNQRRLMIHFGDLVRAFNAERPIDETTDAEIARIAAALQGMK